MSTSQDCLLEPNLGLLSNTSSHSNENTNIMYDFDGGWSHSTSSNQHTHSDSSSSLIMDPLKPMGALLASSNYHSSQSFALPSVTSNYAYYTSSLPNNGSRSHSEYTQSSQTHLNTYNPLQSDNSTRMQSFSFPMPRMNVMGLEINASHQNYNHSYKKKNYELENGTMDSKNKVQDTFDLEPLSFFKREQEPNENAFRSRILESIKSPLGEFGHMDKVFESLDKLIPEMDQDLFQPAELNHLSIPESVRHVDNHPMPSPRYEFSSRNILQNVLLPNTKPLASLPGLVARNSKHMAICKVAGCERRVRSKGVCKTHGGGRKCSIIGCSKSSQNGEFCIGHGGGKKCRQEGCAKAAQSHGLCKAHGGGARCKFPDCTKSSQGGGLCRAHGGGKRCQALDCQKGAQRGNFCATHGGFRNCKFDGCVRTDRGGGFCEVHRRGRLCRISGCKKLARNEGLCTMHIRAEKQAIM